jgi:hypothetical protein
MAVPEAYASTAPAAFLPISKRRVIMTTGAGAQGRDGNAEDAVRRSVRGYVMSVQRTGILAVLAVLLATTAAVAQTSPPSRVGRLSYVGGSVSFEPAGTESWAAAELNRPVTIGDRIWTDWDSRAEIELGDAVVRLGSRTGFSFLNLDAQTAQMQLTAGTMIVHVRTLQDGEQDEIDTPNVALSLETPGTYRVHVFASGRITRVDVIRGRSLASGGGQTYPIAAQQSATFSGINTLRVAYSTLGEPDALDEWSLARDREEAQAAPAVTQYVPANMVGIYDLDTYGSWQNTAQWGYAWFPNVVTGWAPYRFGHWVWIYPWGWTWIDDEPWGFAPFHYGRWAYWQNAWCWVPGPQTVEPIYTPAQVVWTRGGTSGTRAAGLARGPQSGPRLRRPVGWLPLGPDDVYLPRYAVSAAYVRNVNLANARDLSSAAVAAAYRPGGADLRYGNRNVHGAVTVVPRAAFSASEAADAHRVVLPRRGVLDLRLTPDAPAVTPTRLSVFGSRIRMLQVPPRQLTHRPVVARLLPARAAVSFDQQQALIRANRGRPLSAMQWEQLRSNTPAAAVRLAPDIAPGSRPPGPQRPHPQVPAAYRAHRPGWAPTLNDRRHPPMWLPRAFAPGAAAMVPRHLRPDGAATLTGRHAPGTARPSVVPVPRWRSAPPMYRVRTRFAPQQPSPAIRLRNTYAPPRTPPPMYRPVEPQFTPSATAPPAYHPAFHPTFHPAPARPFRAPQPPR